MTYSVISVLLYKSWKFWFSAAECVRLNIIDPPNLIRSGIIRSCAFTGVGIVLLEQVCHHDVGL